MHQSKKEVSATQWNQKISFDSFNQLENEELLENTLLTEQEPLLLSKRFTGKN